MPNANHPKQHAFATEFVADILQHALGSAGKPGVYGIAGLQGSGKSTLAAQVAELGKQAGLRIVVLSIDDFYFGKRRRNLLARNIHPLLATRGPPGTHEVSLACEVIDKLKRGEPVRIPRFDKLGDTRLPPSRWQRVDHRVDLIILEGWFLFATPTADTALSKPLNHLERDEDPDCVWRRYCNTALKQYAKIWQRIDRSVFLRGPGFDQVKQWRWQQEQSLQAANPDRRAMSKADIERFVLLFERTSRHVFPRLPGRVDRVVKLDENRIPKT